jgi:DNA-binding beta-propeller fold protein YncE
VRRSHRGGRFAALGIVVLCGSRAAAQAPAPAPPERDYFVFAASEGNDQISLVRFGPGGARVERRSTMGTNRTELVGPHGLAVSPDGAWYYVTTAHGMPNGALWKYSTVTGEQAGRTELGLFPATLQLAPGGHYAWVVNFNLYGDMVPSTVSVVYTDPMIEIKRIPTCVMPHGSRLSPDGSRHYSACMMNDLLIEIDAATMAVSRHFMLGKGAEHGMSGAPGTMGMHGAADGPGMAAPGPGAVSCSPTWAQPSVDGKTVWVACNKTSDLVEIDVASWSMRRRIAAGDGVYNLAVSHDGHLVVGTNKRGRSVSIIDAATGAELARVPTTRRLPSGLVISPDDRYAFVTLEGVGSEPGTVEIIDLHAFVRVASVDVGQQAGGIDFWKTEAPR